MALDTIDLEEFNRRLDASNERLRQERLAIEAQNQELRELIGQYRAVLRDLEQSETTGPQERSTRDLRALLLDLAEHSVSVAATL